MKIIYLLLMVLLSNAYGSSQVNGKDLLNIFEGEQKDISRMPDDGDSLLYFPQNIQEPLFLSQGGCNIYFSNTSAAEVFRFRVYRESENNFVKPLESDLPVTLPIQCPGRIWYDLIPRNGTFDRRPLQVEQGQSYTFRVNQNNRFRLQQERDEQTAERTGFNFIHIVDFVFNGNQD